MKTYMQSEATEHEMKLVQMGAKVEQVHSRMCYIRFLVEGVEVEYVYNINKKKKYFLQRKKPYPLALKVTNTEKELVSVIEVDLEQFKNAARSHNINYFLNIGTDLIKTIQKFEDLYLYYNVPKEDCQRFAEQVKALKDEIYVMRDKSERVYFEKEPENL